MRDAHEAMGRRLRELRLERDLQQADVARRLGVSPAYLSLIEKGKRAVQLPLLFQALELYGVGMEDFMSSLGEPRVDDGLARLLDEPLFRTLNLSREDLATLGAEPKVATTITALFNLYKNTRSQLDHLLRDLAKQERDAGVVAVPVGGERDEPYGFDYSPFDEVTDFLEEVGNWFPSLEERADQWRRDHGLAEVERVTADALTRALREQDVHVQLVRGETSSVIRRLDREGGVLRISRDVPEHRRLFQLAHAIGLRLLDDEKLHEPIIAETSAGHSQTARLLKIHLANYFAGAVLLPYETFFREAQRLRYDVERLAHVFDASYETVAHRLCNLSDPKRRAVPFHFQRVDVAGNISKRYSATGLKFPHGTGSCPKWIVHTAFLTPHAIAKQYSLFPDGSIYFCFAKVIAEPIGGSLAKGTCYAIGLGTHADNAKHLAYADEMPFVDPQKMVVPVGTTCRFCERTDCNQRAAPSYKFAFRVDEYIKKDNFFSPLVVEDELTPAQGEPEPDVALAKLRRRR
ncbi:helix-turn-helix domain-containing protein [Sandaracinus amylolyticus]|uniref:helix-turn-helix domain-containing protein n=1 Tax=Sandaracinus amylolyticus TaxID=927083 RepID=UPI001F1835E3|nr:short-chain fatty acyl-CoA regulator family protein [Sandaracinus amylolyticus]UJR79446.1 XRE family transcriptional regulator [Sandaracinus amylolyticus]